MLGRAAALILPAAGRVGAAAPPAAPSVQVVLRRLMSRRASTPRRATRPDTSRRAPSPSTAGSATAPAGETAGAEAGAAGDVVAFSCDRRRFFRLMGVASLAQGTFWVFLSTFALELRDHSGTPQKQTESDAPADLSDGEELTDDSGTGAGPVQPSADKDAPLAGPITRYSIFFLSIFMSATFLGLGYLLPRRFINEIVRLADGNTLRIRTYTLTGLRTFEAPIRDLAFAGLASANTTTTMPLRIQGHRYFFMLDGRLGRFNAPVFNDIVRRSS